MSGIDDELRGDGLIRLHVRPRVSTAWVVPGWATICGAVASGALSWRLADGVQLLLTLLLIEAGWGTLWSVMATTDWATPLRRWRNWHLGDRIPTLPYTQPGSPGHHLAQRLSRARSWWQTVLIPAVGSDLSRAILGLVLSLTLAAAAGVDLVLLTAAALATMELALVLNGASGSVPGWWDGALRMGLPWLAGHLAFGPLTPPSLALAAAFSVAVVGAAASGVKWRRLIWTSGQLSATAVLISLRQPVGVLFITLFLVPQWLLDLGSGNPKPHSWPQRAWIWLLGGMLLAAWML